MPRVNLSLEDMKTPARARLDGPRQLLPWLQNGSEATPSRGVTLVLPGRCAGIKAHGFIHTYTPLTKLVTFTTLGSYRLHGSTYHGMA